MKKIIFVLSIALCFMAAQAQYPLQKGENQHNAGLGFSSWELPVYLGFDHGIHKDISIGLEGSYRNYRGR